MGEPRPIFSGTKNENFTMAPMGSFSFVFLILRNPPMEIGKIVSLCRPTERENYAIARILCLCGLRYKVSIAILLVLVKLRGKISVFWLHSVHSVRLNRPITGTTAA